MDERELERVLRQGLEARATDADVRVPVVDRAREEVARRRRTRWSVGAAAAAVVLVIGGAAVALRGGAGEEERAPVGDPTTTAETAPAGIEQWRTEYWRGVAVDVPADWGNGAAAFFHDGCLQHPGGIVGADGEPQRAVTGWVGRPVAVDEQCATEDLAPLPGPFVWFDALDDVELMPGVESERVELDGVTVTVAADDPELRDAILARIRTSHLCEAALPELPRARATVSSERRGGLILALVCAYRLAEDGGYFLAYAAEVDPADAETAFAAAERASAPPSIDCFGERTELVVLHATYNDEFPNDVLDRSAVYDLFCGGSVDLGQGGLRALTPASIAPLTHNGITSVIPGLRALSD